jgi:hypothetical protein
MFADHSKGLLDKRESKKERRTEKRKAVIVERIRTNLWLVISVKYVMYYIYVVLGGLVVSVLATGPKVRGFNQFLIFKGDKNP